MVMGKYGSSRTQLQEPASLEAMTVRGDINIAAKDSEEAVAPAYRAAAPRQQAPRKAAQWAKVPGISFGGITRELGISRNTVNKYARALAPPGTGRQGDSPNHGPKSLPVCVFAEQELTAFWLDINPTFAHV